MITELESRLTIVVIVTFSLSFWLLVTIIVFVQMDCLHDTGAGLFIIGGRSLARRTSSFKYHFVGALIFINPENHLEEKCVCDTSIIHRYWTMTVAECVDIFEPWDFKESVRILSNSHTWRIGKEHRVQEYFVHKNFYQNRQDYDITIIKVTEPFIGARISIARLPAFSYNYVPNSTATLLSWGLATNNFTTVRKLKKGNVLIIDQNSCAAKYNNFNEKNTERIICTEQLSEKNNMCLYQPGAPLVQNYMVVGINLWSRDCEFNDMPEVYVKLAYFQKDILNIINDNYNYTDFMSTVIEENGTLRTMNVIPSAAIIF